MPCASRPTATDFGARALWDTATVVEVTDGTVLLALLPGADPQHVLDRARAAGAVEHFAFEQRRLSDVFREAVGAELEDVDGPDRARSTAVRSGGTP